MSVLTSKTSVSSAGKVAADRLADGRVAIEPAVIVAGVQYDRHRGVDGSHQLVGISDDNCEALQSLAVCGILPCVPQTGKAHHLSVGEAKAEGLSVGLAPLVEPGRRDDATALLERLCPPSRCDFLGTDIDSECPAWPNGLDYTQHTAELL